MWSSRSHPMLGPTSMGEKIIHDVYVIHQSSIHYRNVFQNMHFKSILCSSIDPFLIYLKF